MWLRMDSVINWGTWMICKGEYYRAESYEDGLNFEGMCILYSQGLLLQALHQPGAEGHQAWQCECERILCLVIDGQLRVGHGIHREIWSPQVIVRGLKYFFNFLSPHRVNMTSAGRERTPKESAFFYSRLAEENGFVENQNICWTMFSKTYFFSFETNKWFVCWSVFLTYFINTEEQIDLLTCFIKLNWFVTIKQHSLWYLWLCFTNQICCIILSWRMLSSTWVWGLMTWSSM